MQEWVGRRVLEVEGLGRGGVASVMRVQHIR